MDKGLLTVIIFSCSLFGYGFLFGAWIQRKRNLDQARGDAAVRMIESFAAAAERVKP